MFSKEKKLNIILLTLKTNKHKILNFVFVVCKIVLTIMIIILNRPFLTILTLMVTVLSLANMNNYCGRNSQLATSRLHVCWSKGKSARYIPQMQTRDTRMLQRTSPLGKTRTQRFGVRMLWNLAIFSFLKKVSGIQTLLASVMVRQRILPDKTNS